LGGGSANGEMLGEKMRKDGRGGGVEGEPTSGRVGMEGREGGEEETKRRDKPK